LFIRNFDRIFARTVTEMNFEIPIKLKANHILFGSAGCTIMDVIAPVVRHMVGQYTRLRSRRHGGLDAELATTLESFGIPRECLHTSIGGTFTDENYFCWLQQQELKEKELFAEQKETWTPASSGGEQIKLEAISKEDH